MRKITQKLQAIITAIAVVVTSFVYPLGISVVHAEPLGDDTSTVWNGAADTSWYNAIDTDFTLTTAEQLAGFATLVNDGNTFTEKTIALGANIVLNDLTGWNERFDEDGNFNDENLRSWTAIGTSSKPFSGTFEGNNHVISGIYINNTRDEQGLFGYAENSTIKNVGVEQSYIKGGISVGGVLGNQNGGTITNAYFLQTNTINSGLYGVGEPSSDENGNILAKSLGNIIMISDNETIFKGWYSDVECNTSYTDNAPKTADTTTILYADSDKCV